MLTRVTEILSGNFTPQNHIAVILGSCINIINSETGEITKFIKIRTRNLIFVPKLTPLSSLEIITGQNYTSIKLINLETGIIKKLFPSLSAYRKVGVISSSLLAISIYNKSDNTNSLEIWNFRSEELVKKLPLSQSVDLIVPIPNSDKLILKFRGSQDVNLFDYETGELTYQFKINAFSETLFMLDSKSVCFINIRNKFLIHNILTGESESGVVKILLGDKKEVVAQQGIQLSRGKEVLDIYKITYPKLIITDFNSIKRTFLVSGKIKSEAGLYRYILLFMKVENDKLVVITSLTGKFDFDNAVTLPALSEDLKILRFILMKRLEASLPKDLIGEVFSFIT
jgi:hypothetical protein